MRSTPSRSQFVFRRKLEAIAVVTLLVLVGFTIKPPTRTQADSLDTPTTERKKAQATTTARVLQRQKQQRQIRAENYDLERFPITAANEYHWRHLLWTTAVVEPREPFVAETLNQILKMSVRTGLAPAETKTVDQAMKVGTQLYLGDPDFYGSIGQRFVETIEQSPDPEWVAVALSGLAKGKFSTAELVRLSGAVKARFPGWATNVYLQTTMQEIADTATPQRLPSLQELLAWQIAPQQLHLYVLCRRDRRVLCRSVLKDRDGKFVRQGKELWSVALLLESIHELGWNFTRGQTPQGIYRIEGVVPQPDDEFFRAYGQFSLVNLYVPFEPGAKSFLPNQPGRFAGSLANYTALLPPGWRDYRPLQQSFWAGKAGRGLFRIHGSGESVDFFRGKDKTMPDSYNWNPTIGCLSARELYNEQGQLLQADMPKLLQTLQQVGGDKFEGYLVVVDVPADDAKPVSLSTIEAALNPATGRTSQVKQNRAKPIAGALKQPQPMATVMPQTVTIRSVTSQAVAKPGAGMVATTQAANSSSTELDALPIAY